MTAKAHELLRNIHAVGIDCCLLDEPRLIERLALQGLSNRLLQVVTIRLHDAWRQIADFFPHYHQLFKPGSKVGLDIAAFSRPHFIKACERLLQGLQQQWLHARNIAIAFDCQHVGKCRKRMHIIGPRQMQHIAHFVERLLIGKYQSLIDADMRLALALVSKVYIDIELAAGNYALDALAQRIFPLAKLPAHMKIDFEEPLVDGFDLHRNLIGLCFAHRRTKSRHAL